MPVRGKRDSAGGSVTVAKAKKKASRKRQPKRQRAITHARPQRTPKAERVGAFIELMLSGQYVDGKTPREKAPGWQVSNSCAEKDAAEASRYIRRACGSPEDIKARLIVQLQGLAKKASDADRPRAAVAAIREMAAILGLHKQAVELTGPDGAPLVPGVVVLPEENDPPGQDQGRAPDSVGTPPGTPN